MRRLCRAPIGSQPHGDVPRLYPGHARDALQSTLWGSFVPAYLTHKMSRLQRSAIDIRVFSAGLGLPKTFCSRLSTWCFVWSRRRRQLSGLEELLSGQDSLKLILPFSRSDHYHQMFVGVLRATNSSAEKFKMKFIPPIHFDHLNCKVWLFFLTEKLKPCYMYMIFLTSVLCLFFFCTTKHFLGQFLRGCRRDPLSRPDRWWSGFADPVSRRVYPT